MKRAVMICLLINVITYAMESNSIPDNGENNQPLSILEQTKLFQENYNAAMRWCISGVISALSASRLATLCQVTESSVHHKITKRCYYFLLFSTIVSICSMLKYAHKNKQLLEKTTVQKN